MGHPSVSVRSIPHYGRALLTLVCRYRNKDLYPDGMTKDQIVRDGQELADRPLMVRVSE